MRIVVACPDRPGVLAAIASRLYDLGADFGDTSFAVLGEAAEFTAICRLPDDIDGSEIARQLSLVPELAQAAISATPFPWALNDWKRAARPTSSKSKASISPVWWRGWPRRSPTSAPISCA